MAHTGCTHTDSARYNHWRSTEREGEEERRQTGRGKGHKVDETIGGTEFVPSRKQKLAVKSCDSHGFWEMLWFVKNCEENDKGMGSFSSLNQIR